MGIIISVILNIYFIFHNIGMKNKYTGLFSSTSTGSTMISKIL